MKNLVILGSTGSIGQNALDVVRRFKKRFKVLGLSANNNTDLLAAQAKEFKPEFVVAKDSDALIRLAGHKKADIVLMAISGSAALRPLIAAIDAGKKIALANKEALVAAGGIVMKRAKASGARIIPVDSEHSAVFQCIEGAKKSDIKNIFLTATGGPLKDTPAAKMRFVSPKQAIRHPRWSMGKKISVDSATMMNKGLEVIEANWLFGVDIDNIKIIVHPEAVVHSMVEFNDGSVIAQMGATDMRLPIQYALLYPERIASGLNGIDLAAIKKLNFLAPDFKKFPCIKLAYEAAKTGGTMPAVLNAANEELVAMFLDSNIRLTDIAKGVAKVMNKHKTVKNPGLTDILKSDKWAREEVNGCRR
ncbi:MAG: 1-deoxy-D-xylulose-5-phosphate reductoisomerase [Candidatus Omnitrophica bacterium CG12_big_fil_rev_8_21_14_0_65_43_15]|uniref:1-deoxy-D-xylulose 5-phosphate reductoisomerase n=1 Tax=Candidatus Taenaricola geysiri TaxID=1974752 RepID=A0A2J0LEP6_9BACT|nr:MAG: 1-deoxy-D-xylulose-5-phosphate reductoisomerase [Candidatus Omnitrophica bacterium CG1_02_43_210]PIR65853.1 MAG: 1-deoxy-D-xylulose-5-phosphate reductoisomerase [Candidatus Omnitrophica bacterium CG10_big_fil_rev_8_21_14_0_10_43_8]PIV12480.1 MAG: 1-deoxy-D-xylulose-5-phosphate reductoisomerase [Candidatus Omnitrophica bacterium CG03_land_8_20_14_0_80_43_22]PIW66332.1 MAG: 1-deoxy-D-xylulose-5-phosphate reductoisomerase [Candidatus Omnitrophica bacterium CG12_big_fil_rev_8_21_14_0_65_43_1